VHACRELGVFRRTLLSRKTPIKIDEDFPNPSIESSVKFLIIGDGGFLEHLIGGLLLIIANRQGKG